MRGLILHSNTCIVDGEYFVCAKMMWLLVAEEAWDHGQELEFSGIAATMAYRLQTRAPAAIGPENWRDLLRSSNYLVHPHIRAGMEAPGPADFFLLLDIARVACRDAEISTTLDLI